MCAHRRTFGVAVFTAACHGGACSSSSRFDIQIPGVRRRKKDEEENKFDGNDNELYVLNTQLQVLTRCYELLLRGDISTDKFQKDGNPTCEPFVHRYENKLPGWTMTTDILIPNGMTIC